MAMFPFKFKVCPVPVVWMAAVPPFAPRKMMSAPTLTVPPEL